MRIVDPLPDFLTMPGSDPELLRAEYLDIVTRAIDGHERSQQTALGPSEIGHPCARRLGYKLLGHDENPGQPNWKATVGTALHTWLEEAFGADNRRHYQPDGDRWVLEQTLYCGQVLDQALLGHCDLYDQVTFTVVDHKTVGPEQLRKYKANGPGEQYRIQAHIYGRGWQLRGRRVDTVAVMFLPRNGELKDAYWWHEPYDEQIAVAGIQRVEGIARTVKSLGDPALALLPTADAWCRLCPYYLRGATDVTEGCPGDPGGQIPTASPAVQELSLAEFEGLAATPR